MHEPLELGKRYKFVPGRRAKKRIVAIVTGVPNDMDDYFHEYTLVRDDNGEELTIRRIRMNWVFEIHDDGSWRVLS